MMIMMRMVMVMMLMVVVAPADHQAPNQLVGHEFHAVYGDVGFGGGVCCLHTKTIDDHN